MHDLPPTLESKYIKNRFTLRWQKWKREKEKKYLENGITTKDEKKKQDKLIEMCVKNQVSPNLRKGRKKEKHKRKTKAIFAYTEEGGRAMSTQPKRKRMRVFLQSARCVQKGQEKESYNDKEHKRNIVTSQKEHV